MTGAPSAGPARAALASVGTAGFLLALKAAGAEATGSVAMLGSLADTTLDLVASVVTLWAVRVAARPADGDHRFGHGKAEALAALFQVALIAASAAGIVWAAIPRLTGAAPAERPGFGIGISVAAMAATLLLLLYQRRVIARTGSLAIRADHAHYQADLALNGAVIAALALDRVPGLAGADAFAGIAIAAWLTWGAWRAAAGAIDQLMDREWPPARREAFLAIARRHPALRGIHDLRTRTSGARDFVQFHVWVAPTMTVAAAHRVMDEVEGLLAADFPGVEILIHPDPAGHVDAGLVDAGEGAGPAAAVPAGRG